MTRRRGSFGVSLLQIRGGTIASFLFLAIGIEVLGRVFTENFERGGSLTTLPPLTPGAALRPL